MFNNKPRAAAKPLPPCNAAEARSKPGKCRGHRKGGETMSEKEKAMCEKISKLPPELQEKFFDKVDGAVMAMNLLDSRKEADNDAQRN